MTPDDLLLEFLVRFPGQRKCVKPGYAYKDYPLSSRLCRLLATMEGTPGNLPPILKVVEFLRASKGQHDRELNKRIDDITITYQVDHWHGHP